MARGPALGMLLSSLLLMSCDPPQVGGPGEAVLKGGAQPGVVPISDAPPQEAPQVGVPDDGADKKMEPGSPEEMPPPPPDGTGPAPAVIPEGTKAVTIRGVVKYADYTAGAIQIDVMDGPHQGPTGTHPKVVQLQRLEKPGPFELQLPAGVGKVYFNAFNDADENGRPDREDPRGSYVENPLEVKDGDLGNVEIFLTVEKIPPPPNGI